ncbi:MAG: DUF4810 domain-containing protein [Comamonadaceae bacterium]|nr:DUF4810 domain-containing protein [Comamonadaceae bacterium]
MSARRYAKLAALAVAAVLAGCAAAPEPLYQWGNYQQLVYQHLNADTVGADAQLLELQQQAEKARAGAKALPPGFRAHVGLLLLRLGRDGEAFSQFQAEKAAFPESAPYMDFLLRRAAPAPVASSAQ